MKGSIVKRSKTSWSLVIDQGRDPEGRAQAEVDPLRGLTGVVPAREHQARAGRARETAPPDGGRNVSSTRRD